MSFKTGTFGCVAIACIPQARRAPVRGSGWRNSDDACPWGPSARLPGGGVPEASPATEMGHSGDARDGQTASLAAHSVLERCLGHTAVTLPLAVPLCLDLALTGPLLGSSFQVAQEGRAAGGPSVAQPPPSAPISGAGWEPHISAGAEPTLKGGGILLGTLGLPEGDPGALEPKSRLSGLGRSCPPHREGGNALSFLSQRISAHWAPEYSDFNPINCAQWSSEQIPAGGISDFTRESHCGLVGAPEDEEVLSVWRESEDVDLVPACSPWARASVPRGLDPCLTNVSADWGPSGHP